LILCRLDGNRKRKTVCRQAAGRVKLDACAATNIATIGTGCTRSSTSLSTEVTCWRRRAGVAAGFDADNDIPRKVDDDCLQELRWFLRLPRSTEARRDMANGSLRPMDR
jgi:hypothetical protein